MLLRLVVGLVLLQAAFAFLVPRYEYGVNRDDQPLPEARFRSLHEAQYVKDRMMSVIEEILKQRRFARQMEEE